MQLTRLLILLLLAAPVFAELPSRVGTVSENFATSGTGWTTRDVAHTATLDTTLMLVTVSIDPVNLISGVVWDPAGVNESFTLVDQTPSSDASGDEEVYTFCLVAPTAKTAVVRLTGNSVNFSATVVANYTDTVVSGTGAAACDAATNFVDDDVDDTGNGTVATLASGGTSGNLNYAAASFRGGDQDPVDIDVGTEVAEVNDTGVISVLKVAEVAAPSGIVFDPASANPDEYAAQMIELVGAASSSATVRRRRIMQEMNQ